MARQPRYLPADHSFHITLRCNSRQFLIAKGLRRDVLLAVLTKAKQDEYTKNWINSPCHSGFRYMPDMSSLESTKPARCYPYKKPISRIVKTWSWKTK